MINLDDPYGDKLAAEFDADHLLGRAATSAPTCGRSDLRFDAAGSRFALRDRGRASCRGRRCRCRVASTSRTRSARSPAPSRSGSSSTTRSRRWPSAERVPGRFEPVDEGQPFAVLVDYAHTPDSLENVLVAARQITRRARLICVFGCGGDRDRDKRPLMGAIADRLADLARRHLRQPALRGSGGDHRRDPRGDGRRAAPRSRSSPTAGRRSRSRSAAAARGRHGRDRRQGPRAGPGVRGRAEDPLRRPRGRPRGAAGARGDPARDRARAGSGSPARPAARSRPRGQAGGRDGR